jgi:Na+-driven multidrug efflux pump
MAFTKDNELINITAQGLRYVFISFPFIGFQMVASTFFQSIGKALTTIFLTATRQWIFLIPILFILPNFLKITGVWISMPIADTASALMAMRLLYAELKKFDKKEVLL